MSNSTNFRVYDPVAQLIATGGGGGGLPATGGTLTGNLMMQVPSKVVQCQAPTGPCDLTNKAYVDSLIGGGPFLPLSGGAMSGQIVQSLAPVVANDLANKAYVDAQVASGTPDATTSVKGKVQLSGDLDGTAAAPVVASLAITNAKLANLSAASQLKGSSSASSAATDITLGSGLSMVSSTLSVDSTTLPVIPVSKGGTGATTLTGYLKGSGTTPITSVSSVPTTDLTGQFVGSVNGIAPVPTNGGNVTMLFGNVTTGTLAARPVSPGTNGNIYVVSGDSTPSNNGRTYISDGTAWQEVTTNQAATDARYVIKSGDTMTGNLVVPSGTKVQLSDLPTVGTDAANKNYVDAQIAGGSTPDATTSVKGKLQLGGDLSGTAAAPVVASLAITNAKLANLSAVSQLKGSSSASSAATDITLGSGLTMTSSTLSVDSTTLNKAGASQFGVVEFDPTGDLAATTANSGIGVVKPLAITNAKLANLSAVSQLKGSSSASSAATDITLGSGLTMTSNALSVDTTSLSATFLLLSGGTMSGQIVQSLAPVVANDLVNKAYVDAQVAAVVVPDATSSVKGIVQLSGDLSGTAAAPVVASLAITNAKLANLSAVSQLKGSSSASSAATDITLGSGLTMTSSTLSVDSTTLNKAGASQFGVVEFDPTGDLAATTANSGIGVVKPLAITNAKLANLSAVSQLKGSSSASSAATDITLGSSMSMSSGGVLSSQISFFNGSDPNTTAPTDRPLTSGVLYYGTNGSTWYYNGTTYVTTSSIVVSGTANAVSLTTVNAGLAQFGIDTSGRITLKFGSGGSRNVYTHSSESNGLAAGLADSSGQGGGTYGARQTIGTTTVLIGGTGGTAQRTKNNVGEGAMLSVYNLTDNLFYFVSYFLTSIGPPIQAYINVKY
ncbi:tail fiber protein [Wiseana iridescent virus]|uniref:Uncharacterized protein n=1 Tax=Wiseana iridescent virus TaxID=68347 RepID=G0T594_IRV9|nr:tail fiber protein [Wiseana iridescent virus]ADO00411.1 hypothetical protein [Wiseana iridescent virus]